MTDNIRILTDGRDGRRRFAVGNGGRPIGAKAKLSRDLLAQIKAMGPAAVTKLWDALQKDERWAIELILLHVLPKDRTIEFEQYSPKDIVAAIEAGDISPSEAHSFAGALAKLREIEDLEGIRAKLIELEAAVTDGATK